eukprot:CAMPEP_0194299610 /NCGR_PEP_ID=MMETSP0169-20130528/60807_1 /TAXON_ID=218684 /ORGANISM="Corethron pennatum, Strain L29A3" /LENGTH=776 /DNA_ID=CAMNT_0039049715 /DNA_START=812 /DNA_END=3139 /DNA_ORIENTATION=+
MSTDSEFEQIESDTPIQFYGPSKLMVGNHIIPARFRQLNMGINNEDTREETEEFNPSIFRAGTSCSRAFNVATENLNSAGSRKEFRQDKRQDSSEGDECTYNYERTLSSIEIEAGKKKEIARSISRVETSYSRVFVANKKSDITYCQEETRQDKQGSSEERGHVKNCQKDRFGNKIRGVEKIRDGLKKKASFEFDQLESHKAAKADCHSKFVVEKNTHFPVRCDPPYPHTVTNSARMSEIKTIENTEESEPSMSKNNIDTNTYSPTIKQFVVTRAPLRKTKSFGGDGATFNRMQQKLSIANQKSTIKMTRVVSNLINRSVSTDVVQKSLLIFGRNNQSGFESTRDESFRADKRNDCTKYLNDHLSVENNIRKGEFKTNKVPVENKNFETNYEDSFISNTDSDELPSRESQSMMQMNAAAITRKLEDKFKKLNQTLDHISIEKFHENHISKGSVIQVSDSTRINAALKNTFEGKFPSKQLSKETQMKLNCIKDKDIATLCEDKTFHTDIANRTAKKLKGNLNFDRKQAIDIIPPKSCKIQNDLSLKNSVRIANGIFFENLERNKLILAKPEGSFKDDRKSENNGSKKGNKMRTKKINLDSYGQKELSKPSQLSDPSGKEDFKEKAILLSTLIDLPNAQAKDYTKMAKSILHKEEIRKCGSLEIQKSEKFDLGFHNLFGDIKNYVEEGLFVDEEALFLSNCSDLKKDCSQMEESSAFSRNIDSDNSTDSICATDEGSIVVSIQSEGTSITDDLLDSAIWNIRQYIKNRLLCDGTYVIT